MKELLLILFFSEWVLLTPQAVDISTELVLTPDKPMTAITSGAGVHIDLKDFAGGVSLKKTRITESTRILRERIAPESVRGYLLTDAGEQTLLDRAFFSLENDQAWIVLTASTGIPTDLEFVTLSIQSSVELRNVRVYWKNYSH
jgi:hypothetical protein